ncbi:MAG: hypothetical protein JWQ38_2221 [Flavipsychrobacter sp.]|nr:hypothetical protein [Flavipsychrobacter sp.]
MSTMQKNTAIDNRIFTNALVGSLLLIVAIGFTITNLPSIAMLQLPYTAIASVLAMSSVSFLYQAIKQDKRQIA